MNEMKRLLSFVRRAVDDYKMIEDGDKIAIGISGGKDSLTLLEVMAEMRRFYPKKYEIVAITVDMGFEGSDFSEIAEFCRRINVEYKVVKTEIAKIIFDVRRESNPCSLCAKMRRGSLHAAAQEAGCNKVALGHHYDDAIETFMMNLLFEGRLGCFSPVTYLSNRKITLIRPMIYAQEKDVQYFTRRRTLPIITTPCADAVTRGAPGSSPAKALGDRGQRLGLPLLACVGMPTKGGSQGCLGRVWEWKVKPWQRGTEGRDLRHQGRS